jgi:hypothetical protein
MESSSSLPVKFQCDKEININPEEYWGEIIQLTFLNDKSEYLSLTRIPHEDEVYFEYNDQINFLYSNVRNVKFALEETILTINVDKPIKGNLPDTFIVSMARQLDNLGNILNLLVQDLK